MQASDCILRPQEGTDFLFFTKNLGVECPKWQVVLKLVARIHSFLWSDV